MTDQIEKLEKEIFEIAPYFAPLEYRALAKYFLERELEARLEELKDDRVMYTLIVGDRLRDLTNQLQQLRGGK
jgi:hypothetical protein